MAVEAAVLIRFLNGPDTERREEHFSRCPFVDFFFSLCLTLFSFFSALSTHQTSPVFYSICFITLTISSPMFTSPSSVCFWWEGRLSPLFWSIYSAALKTAKLEGTNLSPQCTWSTFSQKTNRYSDSMTNRQNYNFDNIHSKADESNAFFSLQSGLPSTLSQYFHTRQRSFLKTVFRVDKSENSALHFIITGLGSMHRPCQHVVFSFKH